MNRFKLLYVSVLGFILYASCAPKVSESFEKDQGYRGSLSLSGAFALYPLAVLWSEDFKLKYPNVRFNISAGGAGKGISDVLTDMVDIGLVSRDLHPQEIARGAYPIQVAKDAVIATINSNHPNIALLKSRGLSQQELKGIFVDRSFKLWSDIDPRFVQEPIQVYIRSDAAGAAETWAKFFSVAQEDLQGIGIFGDPGLAQIVREKPLAIGFNNLNYVFDLKTKKTSENITALPIDRNADQKISPEEDFYQHLDSLTKAISQGRYPSPPARELLFVIQKGKNNKLINEFLRFILQEQAQHHLLQNGYVPLDSLSIIHELEKIKD